MAAASALGGLLSSDTTQASDHVPDPVRAGERGLGDLRHGHALGGQQHYLGPPPGHHRPGAPAVGPQQPSALGFIDLAGPHALRHRPSLAHVAPSEAAPGRRVTSATEHVVEELPPAVVSLALRRRQ